MTSTDHSAEMPTNQRPEACATRHLDAWRLELGDWSTLQASAAPLRLAVFVHEQHVPLAEELDTLDEVCLHAVVFDAQGCALATGRLLPDGHIGRMAVLKSVRGQGLGSAVLQALVQKARERGFVEVVLSAQTHAEAFYVRHGFVPEGAEYLDANIPHVLMRKAL